MREGGGAPDYGRNAERGMTAEKAGGGRGINAAAKKRCRLRKWRARGRSGLSPALFRRVFLAPLAGLCIQFHFPFQLFSSQAVRSDAEDGASRAAREVKYPLPVDIQSLFKPMVPDDLAPMRNRENPAKRTLGSGSAPVFGHAILRFSSPRSWTNIPEAGSEGETRWSTTRR